MKAIQFDRFGGTDVLHEADVEVPQPGPGQVRVSVKAAGVNALDGKIRSGVLQAVFPTPLPVISGHEVAGVVDALGEGVTDMRVGDEVVGWPDTGAYAQYALASTVAPKPANLDWQRAVALPVAGETAERVFRLLGVARGETVLIHGAAGAVGTVAVQLAVARGARVIGTAGVDNQDYVASLGATATVYGDGLVERVRALAPKGTVPRSARPTNWRPSPRTPRPARSSPPSLPTRSPRPPRPSRSATADTSAASSSSPSNDHALDPIPAGQHRTEGLLNVEPPVDADHRRSHVCPAPPRHGPHDARPLHS